MKLGPQQDGALKEIATWWTEAKRPWFYLGGYAGTGKTYLARIIGDHLDCSVAFAAFTGKAAQVMRNNGCHNASTIHSLIYIPSEDDKGDTGFVLNEESAVKLVDLVIIDECSMVDEQLATDLLSFKTPVLVLGDPAQLPPVKGAGYFTRGKPDVMLTEIHRQALDNPIIRMSMDIREGKPLMFGEYGRSAVVPAKKLDPEAVTGADQVLVGMNKTRTAYNGRLRELKGFGRGALPVEGERLVCLKNNREKRFLNGSLWECTAAMVEDQHGVEAFTVSVLSKEGRFTTHQDAYVPRGHFTGEEVPKLKGSLWRYFDEFTYGYALTVHKSQGSQWPRVCLFNEANVFREHARAWLYTGITRAADVVTVVQ